MSILKLYIKGRARYEEIAEEELIKELLMLDINREEMMKFISKGTQSLTGSGMPQSVLTLTRKKDLSVFAV